MGSALTENKRWREADDEVIRVLQRSGKEPTTEQTESFKEVAGSHQGSDKEPAAKWREAHNEADGVLQRSGGKPSTK